MLNLMFKFNISSLEIFKNIFLMMCSVYWLIQNTVCVYVCVGVKADYLKKAYRWDALRGGLSKES